MKAQSRRRLRQIHSWLGLFFAPAILFFALSGTLQALGFQDRGAAYKPPAWIKAVASVHKHGFIGRSDGRPAAAAKPADPAPRKAVHTETLKPFSVFAAILGVLLASTVALGIWIALLDARARRRSILVLLAGSVFPLLLLFA